jgi:NADPH-dependent 2,4-dienoyl-CoA reductase/sulfur reductase-like enzyme
VFVLVVGGGKVGYYLTKELIENGHEVVLMEKDRSRAAQITDELGSVVVPHDGCEGKYLGEAGSNPARGRQGPGGGRGQRPPDGEVAGRDSRRSHQ